MQKFLNHVNLLLGVKQSPPDMVSHKAFSHQELHQASAGFSTANIVGEGGFGNVYRGQLPDGANIAIKRLDRCGLQVRPDVILQHNLCSCFFSARLQCPGLTCLLTCPTLTLTAPTCIQCT